MQLLMTVKSLRLVTLESNDGSRKSVNALYSIVGVTGYLRCCGQQLTPCFS